jgi:hypothetical protein
MPKFILAFMFLIAGSAEAGQVRWFPVNMSLGCVPLSDLYRAYPELDGKETPNEIVDVLQKSATNVKARPFVDQYDSDLYRKSHPNGIADETAKEQAIRKVFTKSNAVTVTWSRNGIDDVLLFYTEELCKTLHRK